MSQPANRSSAQSSNTSISAAATSPALICVDWGTTSFRAYLTTANGTIIERRETPQGISKIEGGAFAPALIAGTRDWCTAHGILPVLMSGMIGSRQGWREAPYAHCPLRIGDLSRGLTFVDAPPLSRIAIVAGATTASIIPDTAYPDVMRGEEAQIFGALARLGCVSGMFVLPGTHAKWATVRDGAISGFATYMTGEVFAALKEHTILGRLISSEACNGDGFARGLDAARRATDGTPGALLSLIFSARTLALFDRLAAGDIADYLSGLLIGAEIREAARGVQEVVIIGSDALSARYAQACEQFGIAATVAPPDCAVAGLTAIAAHAGLIGAGRS